MAQEILFPAAEAPKKLENFLKKRFPVGYVRKLFRKDGIRLNGKRAAEETLARPGDRIQIYIPFEKRATKTDRSRSPAINLPILFENDALVVINKPAGIAVHEAKKVLKRNSVLGILESIYRPEGIHPKLVHRLDKETSGVLIVAKHAGAAGDLERLFKEDRVEKEYLSLVKGKLYLREGSIDFPLPGREGHLVRASTRYKIEKEFADSTLLRVRIDTGRMHQIRLHLARIGHPVAVDDEYGDFSFNKRFRKTYGLKRQFLHAHSIALDLSGKNYRWTAPLPDDLERILQSLASASAQRK